MITTYCLSLREVQSLCFTSFCICICLRIYLYTHFFSIYSFRDSLAALFLNRFIILHTFVGIFVSFLLEQMREAICTLYNREFGVYMNILYVCVRAYE